MSVRKTKQFGAGVPVGLPHMELHVYDQTFKVRGKMSGIRLLHVMSAMDGNTESEASITRVIIQFLSDALLTEDRARGLDYLENSDPPIDLPMLIEIIQWLVEQYTANPTQPSEPSDNGSAAVGPGSMGNASSADVTYVPSTENSSSQSDQPSQLVQS